MTRFRFEIVTKKGKVISGNKAKKFFFGSRRKHSHSHHHSSSNGRSSLSNKATFNPNDEKYKGKTNQELTNLGLSMSQIVQIGKIQEQKQQQQKINLYNNEIKKAKQGIKPDVVSLMRKGIINGKQATEIINNYENSPSQLKLLENKKFDSFWNKLSNNNIGNSEINKVYKVSINQLAKKHHSRFNINNIKPISYNSNIKDFEKLQKRINNFRLIEHIAKNIPKSQTIKTNKFSLAQQNPEIKVYNKFITKQTLTPNDKKILENHFNNLNKNNEKYFNSLIHYPLNNLEKSLKNVSNLSKKGRDLILNYGKKINKDIGNKDIKPAISSLSKIISMPPAIINSIASVSASGVNLINHPIDNIKNISNIKLKFINDLGLKLGKGIQAGDPQVLADILVNIASIKGYPIATKIASKIYKGSHFISKSKINELNYLDKKALETGKFPTVKSIEEQIKNLKKAKNKVVTVTPNKFPKNVIVGDSKKSKLGLEDAGIYTASKGRGNIYFARLKNIIDGGYTFNPIKLLDTLKQEFKIPTVLEVQTEGAIRPISKVIKSKGFKDVEKFNQKYVVGTGKVSITKRSIIGKEKIKGLSKKDKGTSEEEFLIPKGEKLKIKTTKNYIEVDGHKLLVQEGEIIKVKKSGLNYLQKKLEKRIKKVKKILKKKEKISSIGKKEIKYKNPYSKLRDLYISKTKSSKTSKTSNSKVSKISKVSKPKTSKTSNSKVSKTSKISKPKTSKTNNSKVSKTSKISKPKTSKTNSSKVSKTSKVSKPKISKTSNSKVSKTSKISNIKVSRINKEVKVKIPKIHFDSKKLDNKILTFIGTYRERKYKTKPAGKNNPIVVKSIKLETTKNRALKQVSKIVDNNLARSLELKVIGIGKAKKDISKPNLNKFEIKKSKNTPVLKLVEKSKYNFDTKGEKLEAKKQKRVKSSTNKKKSSKKANKKKK